MSLTDRPNDGSVLKLSVNVFLTSFVWTGLGRGQGRRQEGAGPGADGGYFGVGG